MICFISWYGRYLAEKHDRLVWATETKARLLLSLTTDMIVKQVGSVGEIEPSKDFAEVFGPGDKHKLKISEICWSIEEVKRADEFFLQSLKDPTPQKISLTLRGAQNTKVDCNLIKVDDMVGIQITDTHVGEDPTFENLSEALDVPAEGAARNLAEGNNMLLELRMDDIFTRSRDSLESHEPLLDGLQAEAMSILSAQSKQSKVFSSISRVSLTTPQSVKSASVPVRTSLSNNGRGLQISLDWDTLTKAMVKKDLAANAWAELNIKYSELTFSMCLGQGGYGVVHSGSYRSCPVAIKTLSRYSGSSRTRAARSVELIRREVGILLGVHHPYVLLACGWADDPEGNICVVTELCGGGSAAQRIHVSKDMTRSAAVVISKQVACALDFLHYNGIEHRDIKPANVLLMTTSLAQPHSKLADFGMGRFASGVHTPNVGTTGYGAPEVNSTDYGTAADIYSFGLFFYEMITWQRPYSREQLVACYREMSLTSGTDASDDGAELQAEELFEALTYAKSKGYLPDMDLMDKTPTFKEVVLACCELNFVDRPSSSELCWHFENLKLDPDEDTGMLSV
jgi:hypothetical protein